MPLRHPARTSSSPAEPGPRDALSKTRRKREMHDLQDLGTALVALDPAQLSALDLPEKLADAIGFARTLRAHEARRRQMQYIGRLMRDVDDAPIRAAIARAAAGPARERARFAALTRWRERIIDDADGLEAFFAAHPGVPRDYVSTLAAEARDERARNARPHKYRALFRELDRLLADESR